VAELRVVVVLDYQHAFPGRPSQQPEATIEREDAPGRKLVGRGDDEHGRTGRNPRQPVDARAVGIDRHGLDDRAVDPGKLAHGGVAEFLDGDGLAGSTAWRGRISSPWREPVVTITWSGPRGNARDRGT